MNHAMHSKSTTQTVNAFSPQNLFRTANPWALVTGVTSGIGLATTKALLQLGFSVVGVARRDERFYQIQDDLQSSQLFLLKTDIRDIEQVKEIRSWLSGKTDKLNVLVNNAGLAKGVQAIQEGAVSDWNQMIETNVQGLLYVTHETLPLLLKAELAHIVNIGSVAGKWVYPGGVVYCATKHAVRAISDGLRMDLFGSSVRVTNIEPGMVETEFSIVRLGDEEKAKNVYQGMKPLTAGDIADTIVWSIMRPAHVNIQELVVFPTQQASVGQVWRDEKK